MAPLLTPADAFGQTRNGRIFEQEFYPLLDAVFSFAVRLTNDRSRAEDLAQETYLRAWRFVDGYAEGTNAKAWLFRICQNAFINEYRKVVRAPRKVDYEDIVVYQDGDANHHNRYFNLKTEMGGNLIGDEITRAINALPLNFRTVVLLDLEDFTYEEIAVLTEVPIGTVRSRLHRARAILAKQLRGYAADHGYNVQDDQAEMPPAAPAAAPDTDTDTDEVLGGAVVATAKVQQTGTACRI